MLLQTMNNRKDSKINKMKVRKKVDNNKNSNKMKMRMYVMG